MTLLGIIAIVLVMFLVIWIFNPFIREEGEMRLTAFSKFQCCDRCSWVANPDTNKKGCCPQCGNYKLSKVVGRWSYTTDFDHDWDEYHSFIPTVPQPKGVEI